MTNVRHNPVLADPEIRRPFEEEVLVDETVDTIAALVESLEISQRELADRLGVSPGRISQILSGSENLTLRSVAALGWALGVQFDLAPKPMADRRGTPATDDPPAPAWMSRLQSPPKITYAEVTLPSPDRFTRGRPQLRVIHGEMRAA